MIIPAGGKFYLVGQLESSAATETGEKSLNKTIILLPNLILQI